jgi:hypothetical protein
MHAAPLWCHHYLMLTLSSGAHFMLFPKKLLELNVSGFKHRDLIHIAHFVQIAKKFVHNAATDYAMCYSNHLTNRMHVCLCVLIIIYD